jgi:hypothetical protein
MHPVHIDHKHHGQQKGDNRVEIDADVIGHGCGCDGI